jgi:AraC-like DNA-binding protein
VEPVVPRRAVFDRRIAFVSPVVRIARWNCRSGSAHPGAERTQGRPRIVFVRSGNFRVHSSEEIGLLDCTRVGFFNANVPFRSAHPYSGGDSGADFAFRPDLLTNAFGPADDSEHPFPAGWGPADAEVYLLQSLVLRKAAAPVPDELEVDELSLRLLARVAASVAGDAPRAERSLLREREAAEALRGFLSAHPAARHRLDDLARRFESDPFQLCRGFRTVTGTTIHRFLTDVRLRRAIGRLAEGCRNLSELAFDLGFSSHSHFTATFRRRLGITPEAVRGIASARHPSRLHASLRSSTARN